ncbi:uncharacterized protein VDAG_04424 [Verticillium dahliae VdLs.17]|uniref:Uncharacterized protein n=1 Tax=Verticillium dahliae (strain VdLs.17 / ATCC MYA-4575 / FGSC 10137) TaxID=498257 RepID=G2X2A0_VERDV|nr:uncharacterized protein VDAG_04424 [Verticillium dahliae VdLs.17]EGY22986.1 hypothetical protein VDAG_04424 [Verticillium dahliae VdLs.17]
MTETPPMQCNAWFLHFIVGEIVYDDEVIDWFNGEGVSHMQSEGV